METNTVSKVQDIITNDMQIKIEIEQEKEQLTSQLKHDIEATREVQICLPRTSKTLQPVYQYHELKSPRQRYLFDDLKRFYDGTTYVEDVIIPLLKKNNSEHLSRRLINCLSANLHMNVGMRSIIPLSRNDSENCYAIFDLASSYLRELKTWRRKLYDTFHRHERILWPLASKPGWCLETTEGLLNFFRWWVQYNVMTLASVNRHLMVEYMQSVSPTPATPTSEPTPTTTPTSSTTELATGKRRKRKRQEDYLTFRLGVIDLPRRVRMRVYPNFFEPDVRSSNL